MEFKVKKNKIITKTRLIFFPKLKILTLKISQNYENNPNSKKIKFLKFPKIPKIFQNPKLNKKK